MWNLNLKHEEFINERIKFQVFLMALNNSFARYLVFIIINEETYGVDNIESVCKITG